MHGPKGGKVGIKCSILRTLIVLLRGQKAEIKVINGAISKDRTRHIRVLNAENKNPHASSS